MRRSFLIILTLTLCLSVFSSCGKASYPYEPDKYIKVPELPENFTVTEKEISEKIEEKILEIRKNNYIKTPVTDKAAEVGNMVNVSLVCYPAKDYGSDTVKPIQALSDSDCTLIIGDGKYPSEIEKAVVGLFPNGKATARLTYSQSFALKEYAGESVIFEITLNAITELKLPLYNDAFVQSVSVCNTAEEYEKYLFERIKEDLIWDYMLKNSEIITYPSDELNEYSSEFSSYYSNLASEMGITLEEYVSKKYFMELTDFHLKNDGYAKDMVKGDLLLYSLVNRHGLQLTDEEYSAGAQGYAERYGYRSVSLLEGHFGSTFVRKSVQKDKVLAFLSEAAVTVVGESAEGASA